VIPPPPFAIWMLVSLFAAMVFIIRVSNAMVASLP
jgi:hypothetical protein